MLDEGEPDTQPDVELDAAVSDDDDEPTLRTTPPPNARDHHTYVPAVPAKSIANGCAGGSAIDGASNGLVSSDPSVKAKEFGGMGLSRPPLYRENGQPSSPISENTAAADRVVPHSEAPASAGHVYDVFAEYEKTFGADSSTRKPRQRKERNSSSSHGASPVRDKSLSLNPLTFPLSLAHPSTQTLLRNLDLASTVFKHDSGTLAFA